MSKQKQISEDTFNKVLPKISNEIKSCLPDKPEYLLKYANRFVPPKIHSKVDLYTKKMMLKYVLNDEDYLLTYLSILAESFYGKSKSNNPKLYLVIGQTGSGKSNLTAEILKENHNCIVLDSDKYKSFRQDAEILATKYPTLYGFLTGIDSYEHRDNIYNYAINNSYDLIIEKAPDIKKGLINVDIEKALNRGYKIFVSVLAVGKLNSALSIHERYEGQIEQKILTPKLTDLERHNQSYEGLNKIVKKLQIDKKVNISVYKRAESVYENPILVYPREKCEIYNSPYEAMINTQEKDNKKTIKEFFDRYEMIKMQMKRRNAEVTQYKQLEKIEEMYLEIINTKEMLER